MKESTNIQDQVTTTLKRHSLRSTPVRRGVLELAYNKRVALSSNDFETATSADRITVYRTLRTYEATGILHRVQDMSGVDKYALCGDKCSAKGHQHTHAHFHCTSCKETSCLKEINVVSQVLPKGYQIIESNLTYTGTCPACN